MQKENIELSYYSFFTKYSLMEDYGFGSGLINRIYRKILPSVPDEKSFEFFLLKNQNNIKHILNSIDFTKIENSIISDELNTSIKALCSKIAAFGLDSDIYTKLKLFRIESDPFRALLSEIHSLENCDSKKTQSFISLLERIESNIHSLRKYKRKLGVNLHLTIVTRRILEYVNRVKDLIDLKLNITSQTHWEAIIKKYFSYIKNKDSIRRFISRHLDLLTIEVVEHTSNKGEKYIAENGKEYRSFFYKAMFGGLVISFFALLKIIFGSYELTSLGYALIFSLNYAVCFILVKQFGGIIATKQPAMTASTIAKRIDKNDNLEIDSIKDVLTVIKKALSSQFISLVGNFTTALVFACIIFKVLELFGIQNSLGIQPEYLLKGVMPSFSLISYAATAGIFLALSGLISGYIDNKIIASKVVFRMKNSNSFLRNDVLTNFVKNKGGAFLGNISLGFLLGSAFLLSWIFPLSIDIRHIAFSSSYVGYSIMSQSFDITILLKAIMGVLLIGLTNLVVSFSITLLLALKSRGAKISLIPQLLFSLFKDFISNSLEYFIVRDKK